MRRFLILALSLACLVGTGCGGVRFMAPGTAKIAAPAAGKALVNVHRPSTMYGHGVDLIVWDGEKVIGNTHGRDLFQYECEPGRHVFHAKHLNVSVIVADLAAGGVYDLVTDCGPNFVPFQPGYRLWLKELPAGDSRRADIPKWESSETLLALDPAQADKRAAYERREQADVQKYLADFTTGSKQDKAGKIAASDKR
ncbi:hypothetical protein LBMAG53_20890 [Planctomycetota bacterium]|nr:hypothetical protein LBMAG53_20890 [Planctomycetota bacterium]